MKFLLKLSGMADALSERVGRAIMWLILAAVLLSAGNALARKIFHAGSNALTDMQWYLYSGVFGLHPSSWTKYVRVVGRIEHPGTREKGSCHEATKKIQHRTQTSGCGRTAERGQHSSSTYAAP